MLCIICVKTQPSSSNSRPILPTFSPGSPSSMQADRDEHIACEARYESRSSRSLSAFSVFNPLLSPGSATPGPQISFAFQSPSLRRPQPHCTLLGRIFAISQALAFVCVLRPDFLSVPLSEIGACSNELCTVNGPRDQDVEVYWNRASCVGRNPVILAGASSNSRLY